MTTATVQFEIASDVPMPGARNRYPFQTMDAGQSFEIVGEDEARKVRNAAYQFAKKKNKETALRQAAEAKGSPLSAEEKAAVTPLEKGEAGAYEFALRKMSTIGEGENAVHVYRLWRAA